MLEQQRKEPKNLVEKPCSCTEPCGHYAWLEEEPEYLKEDLSVNEDEEKEMPEQDLRKIEDHSYKHKLFMNGQCVKCKGIISDIPETVYTVKGLLEFPLYNFNACNGTLYHIDCPVKN